MVLSCQYMFSYPTLPEEIEKCHHTFCHRVVGSDSVLGTGLRVTEPYSSEPIEAEKAVYLVYQDRLMGRKEPFVLAGGDH